MTTTTTSKVAIPVILCSLLINIKIECTVNVHLHFEINKELEENSKIKSQNAKDAANVFEFLLLNFYLFK